MEKKLSAFHLKITGENRCFMHKKMNSNRLIDKLFNYPYCKKELKIEFAREFKLLEFYKGQTIISPNVINQSLYFVDEGILRSYIIQFSKTKTRRIFINSDFITQDGVYIKKQALEYVECLTNTTLFNINYKQLERFIRINPEAIKLLLSILEEQKLKEIENSALLHVEPSLDRYRFASEILGKTIHELPKQVLASYLRISRKQLGRLLTEYNSNGKRHWS